MKLPQFFVYKTMLSGQKSGFKLFCLKSIYEGLNHCLLVILFSSTFIAWILLLKVMTLTAACTRPIWNNQKKMKSKFYPQWLKNRYRKFDKMCFFSLKWGVLNLFLSSAEWRLVLSLECQIQHIVKRQ